MKAQYFGLFLVAVITTVVSASPAWSYRWGGYNSFGSGYGYGSGLNALRYILPINGYRNYNYNYGGYGNNYNRAFNYNCGHHHHHRRWW